MRRKREAGLRANAVAASHDEDEAVESRWSNEESKGALPKSSTYMYSGAIFVNVFDGEGI
jgi:nucleoside diphosphate kinase